MQWLGFFRYASGSRLSCWTRGWWVLTQLHWCRPMRAGPDVCWCTRVGAVSRRVLVWSCAD